MSEFSFVDDIADMHDKFGVHNWVKQKIKEGNYEVLKEFLEFRINFLQEELTETRNALKNNNPEEVVDGIIDLLVIGIGTLDAFEVNTTKAWKEVHRANISKKVGVKETRPNPLGLPDLIKPKGWVGPDHKGNVGHLGKTINPYDNCPCHVCYMRRGY